jgi:hypothetical protein
VAQIVTVTFRDAYLWKVTEKEEVDDISLIILHWKIEN